MTTEERNFELYKDILRDMRLGEKLNRVHAQYLENYVEQLTKKIEEASSILKGYEQFEADIIADDAMWSPDAISGKHYDSMMNLQERRNDFFAKLNNR